MGSRRSLWSPVLILAVLPILVGELSCSGSGPAATGAPAPSNPLVAPDQTSTALTDSGLAAVQRHIAQREYRASVNSNGLQAPNRVHNLRTYFGATGIRVHDRTRAGSPELLSLNLAGVGRGETPARVGPGEVTSDGARVEIERPGLLEWYENSPAGLEQGVTLKERPAGEGPLVVELLVRGARASLRGERVSFATPTGRQLSYAKLAALDARGHALDAHFELPERSRLRWVVDDGEAVYPVVIDPLLTASADSQLESDQLDTNLGVSVAGAGDVNGDGYADVIVGAYRYDAGEIDEGAAFVFHGSASGIVEAGSPANADAQLESDQEDAWLGWSVAGAGDVNDDGYADVIVGAHRYTQGPTSPVTVQNLNNIEEGVAFVFHGSTSGIVANGNPGNANTLLQANRIAAQFGHSVAGAGDVNGDGYADVIVGAPVYDLEEDSLNLSETGRVPIKVGAAFVFHGSSAGIASGNPSTADTQLMGGPPGNAANVKKKGGLMGWSVAGAGDVDNDGYSDVIVGAYRYHVGLLTPPCRDCSPEEVEERVNNREEGAVFVFLGSAVVGIVGANGPITDVTQAATQIESNQNRAHLGWSVAGAGDVDNDGYADVIVGARLYDAGQTDEGAAFVFLGSAAGIASGDLSTVAAQLESDQDNARMGYSVAGAGDINGDSYADVIVGANLYDAGETDEGAAFVFFGSAGGIVVNGNPANADIQLEANQMLAQLGFSVAAAGDVNDDGAPDLIVGAPVYDAGLLKEGAAFVFLSDPIDLPEPAFIVGLAAGVACLAIFTRLRRRWDRAI